MAVDDHHREGPPSRAIAVVVRVRVQGVGYRWSTVRTAQPLGLRGWVQNLPDGSVEILAEGPTDALDALERWAKDGPTHARVSGVERSDEPAIAAFREWLLASLASE